MSVAYNKFDCFVQDEGRGVHHLNTDTLKILLTNVAPVRTNTVKADLTEIAAGNGYTAGGAAVTGVTYSQASGTATLSGTGPTFTASGGSIGPFRYAVLLNSTVAGNPLIAWWDYGSSATLNTTDTFTIGFGASIFTLV